MRHVLCALVPTLLVVFRALPAPAQVTWQRNIPDTFQHQRWGARPNQAITGAPAGVPGAADAAGDSSWQCDEYDAGPPEEASAFGLCFQASTVNLLYHFRQRGYSTFQQCTAPAAQVGVPCKNNPDCGVGGTCTNTAPANTDQLHDQVRIFKADYDMTAGGTGTAVINGVLDKRGTGPAQGLAGLVAQNFKQDGNDVRYTSSDGTQKNLGKGTLYDHVVAVFKAHDVVNLRLAHTLPVVAGTPQASLWWAGADEDGGAFHNVSVAGFDATVLYFADPDTNPVGANAKGNRNIDAGWVPFPNDKLDRWKKAAAALAAVGDVKPRRFAAGAAIPVPAAAAPTAAEQARLYYTGTLSNDKKAFAIAAGGGFDRYDTVQIRYLETLEARKAVARPAGTGGPAGAAKGLSFTPGPSEAENQINDIWVFPGSADGAFVGANFVFPADAANWSIVIVPASPPFVDPWGNNRSFGALHVSTVGTAGTLTGGTELDLSYETTSGQDLSAWEVAYDDQFDATLSSLGVQCYGSQCGYSLGREELVPDTGACCTGNSCTITLPGNCTGTFLGAGTPCDPNPCQGNACAAAKMKASGAKASCLLKVEATESKKGVEEDESKLAACGAKMTAAFTKAEAKPPCLTTGDAAAIEAKVDAFVDDVVSAVAGAADPPPSSACDASKIKAAGAKASCLLKIEAGATKKNRTPDPAKVQKCLDKMSAGFAKAETKPPCSSTGDAGAIEATVDAFVNDVGRELRP